MSPSESHPISERLVTMVMSYGGLHKRVVRVATIINVSLVNDVVVLSLEDLRRYLLEQPLKKLCEDAAFDFVFQIRRDGWCVG